MQEHMCDVSRDLEFLIKSKEMLEMQNTVTAVKNEWRNVAYRENGHGWWISELEHMSTETCHTEK